MITILLYMRSLMFELRRCAQRFDHKRSSIADLYLLPG
jgi:hypothetical protein